MGQWQGRLNHGQEREAQVAGRKAEHWLEREEDGRRGENHRQVPRLTSPGSGSLEPD